MKVSFLKDRTGEGIDLNKLISDNSVELNNINDLYALIEKNCRC